MSDIEELEESKLGKQEYWEDHYKKENKNFASHGDPGEIWFGEDSVDRIIRWINLNEDIIDKTAKIIDLGCGNGMFLVELANEGFINLLGVDYSEQAVELAQSVAEKYDTRIQFKTCDILQGLNDNYFIVHDKGTYDAVSLSEDPGQKRAKYIQNVHESLDVNGFFIITSCNWTQSELLKHFENHFKLFKVIPTPEFKFGGSIGTVVTSIVLKKI